ncbi:MAG: POTRA domain-containing protein [Bryobacteraceae bacterium]|nr:POTRA domain-containing protein [Bryobacteraceae bacterium]
MLLLALALQLAPPQEIREFPIATLNVEGNERYSTAAILEAAGLKAGQMASKPLFEAARDRLLATGVFDSVGYRYFNASDGKSYDAVFQIVEATPVYGYRFDELPADLEAFVKSRDPLFAKAIPPTKPKVDLWLSLIEEKTGAKAVAKVEPDNVPDRLLIVFRPAGASAVVAEVRFQGNEALPQTVLRPAIAGVAVGVPYNEAQFRQLLDSSVKPLYEERGRLRVRFPKIETKRSTEVNGLDVLVTVEEGLVYTLADVRLQGPPGLPGQDLLRAADFRVNDVANMKSIGQAVERMRQYLRRQGFIGAVATPERRIDDGKRTLDLLVAVDPGAQYKFRSVTIEGLDIQSEPVVRKMWGMKEGEPFNPDYPDVFLRRIRDEQMFDNLGETRSAVKIDSAGKLIDVTLFFGGAAKQKSILKSTNP